MLRTTHNNKNKLSQNESNEKNSTQDDEFKLMTTKKNNNNNFNKNNKKKQIKFKVIYLNGEFWETNFLKTSIWKIKAKFLIEKKKCKRVENKSFVSKLEIKFCNLKSHILSCDENKVEYLTHVSLHLSLSLSLLLALISDYFWFDKSVISNRF